MIYDIIIIFTISFLVRIISVTTGGGGMVLIPILISLGLAPSMAVATNRFGGLSINLTLIKFHKKGQVKWKLAYFLIIPTLIGTLLGTLVIININQDLFQKIIGVVILTSIPFAFYKKKIGLEEIKISKIRKYLGIPLTILASMLAGIFAATGIWFNYLFLYYGLTMLQTVATRKVIGVIISVSSTIILIIVGLINWPIAIAMFMGSGLGAWIGADLGIKAGNLWVKRIFLLVVILMSLKILLF